jgi:hypothetical protein
MALPIRVVTARYATVEKSPSATNPVNRTRALPSWTNSSFATASWIAWLAAPSCSNAALKARLAY